MSEAPSPPGDDRSGNTGSGNTGSGVGRSGDGSDGDASRETLTRAELAAHAGAVLSDRLDAAIGDHLRRKEKRPRDGAGWVDMSAHDLALRCPSWWSMPFDDFVVSVPTAASALARLALRDRHDREPAGVAVARVASQLGDMDRQAAWFAQWYDQELDRAGRAAVRAAATTWAVGALGATRGAALKWSTARMRHEVVGRMIQLRTTWDAATRGAHPDALLVMSARAPDDPVLELQAGFNALVDALIRKQAPLRVRVGSASTAGTVKFAVTSELLERTIDRVVQLVVWHVDRSAAPTVPGRWCADCHILDVCPDGPGLQEIEVRAVVAVDGTDPELG